MSTRPLLGSDPDRSSGGILGDSHKTHRRPRSLMGILCMMLPSSPASEGISLMLNSEDPQERDELTRTWRDHKLEELNFVGTLGALLASCLSSTSTWPDVLSNGCKKPWSVRAIWFSGLVFALFSVIIAASQSIRLHRLSAHRDGLRKIRAGLGRRYSASSDGYQPYRFQVYAWDASQAFLLLSVVLMVVGIAVLVWVSTGYGPDKPHEDGWWDENSKMAVTFTVVLGLAMTVLFASQAALTGTNDDR